MTVQNAIPASGPYVPPGRVVKSSITIETGDPFSGFAALCELGALGDGNALAAWGRATSDDDTNQIWVAITSDAGASWSAPTKIASMTGICPVGLICRADNSLVLMATKRYSSPDMPYVLTSDDNGATWSDPTEIAAAGFGNISFAQSAPIEINGILYAALYGNDADGGDYYIRILSSTDAATWTDLGVSLSAPSGDGYSEPWLCALSTGDVLMTMRYQPTANSGNTGQQTWSCTANQDDPTTWSEPTLAIDQSGASPATIQCPEGDVWLMSRNIAANAAPYAWPSYTTHGASWSNIPKPFNSSTTYSYGQWAYIGASGADGSLCCVVGESYGTWQSDIMFYTFSKDNNS